MRRGSGLMRKKELKIVVTFHTTADAMAMEKICKEKGIPGRLIPVPRILSAGGGLAWAAPPEDKELIEKILAEREINRAGVDEWMV